MDVATGALAELRTRAASDDGSLICAAINSASSAEAGVAVGLLSDAVSRRTLAAALNLREVLAELPASPFAMPMDFAVLSRAARLERIGQSWVLPVDAQEGASVEIIGQGNLCYDIVVHLGERSAFLKTSPPGADIVTPAALALLLESEELLRAVIGLVEVMGVVHNPRFYFTVDDWQIEHAAESFQDLSDLF